MNTLTGTAALIRLALRRDRFTLPLWTVCLAGFTAGITAMSATGFKNQADLVQETRMMATSPAMRLLGLASGATVGGYTMIRGYLTLAVLAALMSVFAVVRHTRQSEETGRSELVGAAVVGRHAGLAAALTVAATADVVLAVLLGAAMAGTGQPAHGAFVAGAAVASVGLVFAGIAALTAQLTTTARAASGAAAAVLGAAFLLSGVGNMAGHADPGGLRVETAWPAWLSPIGWGEQMRPFGGDRWWPLAAAVALFAACVAAAAWLAVRRDQGHGLLPQRPGADRAGRALRSPIGLAMRLQRGALAGWAIGMFGFGLVLGGLSDQVRTANGSTRDWYTRVGGGGAILDAFRTAVVGMAAMAVAIYMVQVLLRIRAEEAQGPVEPVLATGVGRARFVLSHCVAALFGAIALMLVFALGMGVAGSAVLGDGWAEVRALSTAVAVQLPAILVIGAGVVAIVGMLPRAAVALSWVLLITTILLGPMFGPTLRLPGWVTGWSPFTHAPRAPAVPVTAQPLLGLILVGAALLLTGLTAMRRRDLALPA